MVEGVALDTKSAVHVEDNLTTPLDPLTPGIDMDAFPHLFGNGTGPVAERGCSDGPVFASWVSTARSRAPSLSACVTALLQTGRFSVSSCVRSRVFLMRFARRFAQGHSHCSSRQRATHHC